MYDKIVGKTQTAMVLNPDVTLVKNLSLHFSFPTFVTIFFFSRDNAQLFSYTLPGNLSTFSKGSLYLSSYWVCPEKVALGMYPFTRDVRFSRSQDSLTWILSCGKNQMFRFGIKTAQTHPDKKHPPFYGCIKRKLQYFSFILYSGLTNPNPKP